MSALAVKPLLLASLAAGIVATAAVVGVVFLSGDESVSRANAVGLRAWLDYPAEGDTFPLGPAIPIRWHISGSGEVREVEVRANGQLLFTIEDLDHASRLTTQRREWTPKTEGDYLIEVTAIGADGAAGPPSRNTIHVGGEAAVKARSTTAPATAAPDRPQATEAPGATPVPPTSTPATGRASTARPEATATNLPAAPASTSPPPPQPSATPVPPSITPVPPSPTAVPPTSTPPPPTPTPDTEGPPAPDIIGPTDNAILACSANVLLRWSAPSDPSGISNYRVRLQVTSGGGVWDDVRVWDPVTATQVNANAETTCGGFYRWRLLARDGAGNEGPVSSWAYFSLDLP